MYSIIRNYTSFFIMYCIIGCLTLTGCKKKTQAVRQYGYISFTLEWDNLLFQNVQPKTMRFCFYPSGNGPMIQTESETGSLRIALPPDTYGLLVYNSDDHYIQLRNRNCFDKAEAFLPSDSVGTSAPLYGVVVKELTVLSNQDVKHTLNPVFFTKHISFQVHIEDADRKAIRNCTGMITDAIASFHICDRQANMDSTTNIPVALTQTKTGFEGEAILLDYERKEKSTNPLALTFTLANGNTITSTIDLEPILSETKHPNIHVRINATLTKGGEPGLSLQYHPAE